MRGVGTQRVDGVRRRSPTGSLRQLRARRRRLELEPNHVGGRQRVGAGSTYASMPPKYCAAQGNFSSHDSKCGLIRGIWKPAAQRATKMSNNFRNTELLQKLERPPHLRFPMSYSAPDHHPDALGAVFRRDRVCAIGKSSEGSSRAWRWVLKKPLRGRLIMSKTQ